MVTNQIPLRNLFLSDNQTVITYKSNLIKSLELSIFTMLMVKWTGSINNQKFINDGLSHYGNLSRKLNCIPNLPSKPLSSVTLPSLENIITQMTYSKLLNYDILQNDENLHLLEKLLSHCNKYEIINSSWSVLLFNVIVRIINFKKNDLLQSQKSKLEQKTSKDKKQEKDITEAIRDVNSQNSDSSFVQQISLDSNNDNQLTATKSITGKDIFDMMWPLDTLLEAVFYNESYLQNDLSLNLLEHLIDYSINQGLVATDVLLNRILFEITSTVSNNNLLDNSENPENVVRNLAIIKNALTKGIKLYKILQAIIINSDRELAVELILVSLTHIMSISPISLALQLSSVLFYALDENGQVSYLMEQLHLPHLYNYQNPIHSFIYNQTTLSFIQDQIHKFRNVYITDELQRCRLESSFKRAITHHNSRIQSSLNFVDFNSYFEQEDYALEKKYLVDIYEKFIKYSLF